ncbi:MAG: hypothetical protein HY594_02165 [Candidatus Omnitrophica bacterium]|nr:hypothetical protein [Candidatus Omnitrophota bacterium]
MGGSRETQWTFEAKLRQQAARMGGDAVSIEDCCRKLAEELKIKASELIHPTRVAVTGRSVGPSLFHTLEVLGQSRTVKRLRDASKAIVALRSAP